MFIDEITLHLKAGRGGDGVVRWRREKSKPLGGPSGGNGGRGGDVYVIGVRDIGILSSYRNTKEFYAERGQDGERELRRGKDGDDVELKVPVGSRITNLSTGYSVEILEAGQRVKLLSGGKGGLGNDHFKSSTNRQPKEFTVGEDGDEADFLIELLLAVDVGFIGLPNAGKSSLLNALTNAESKVGSFQFTTLEPSLGDLYGLILADIPGLIEGAAEGKGLGHKFLKHIERTKALVHCISMEDEDPAKSYEIVRNELELYNKDIVKKPEIIALTKSDLASDKEIQEKVADLKKISPDVFVLSILDDVSIKEFGEYLVKRFK